MADSKKIFGKEVPENLDPIVITLDNSGNDNLTVFESDDITADVLDKLGDHLSNLTREAGNDPAIKLGSEEITTVTARGNPAGLSDQAGGAESRYLDTFKSPSSEQATAAFEQASKSGLLPFSIRKGKTDDKTLKSGAEILEDVNTNREKSVLTQAVMDILETNNRYAQDAEYVDPHRHTEEDDSNVGHVILQKKLGEHAPRNFPTVAGDGTDVQFKIKKLKNLGLQILLEASGEYFVPDDTDDFASVVAAKAASTAPGLARLGVKIPINRFSAAEVASQVNPQFQKNSNFPDLAGPQRYSHGSYNNPLVPFNSISSTSSASAAILLTLTMSTLITALADVVNPGAAPVPNLTNLGSDITKDNKSAQTNLELRKTRMGSYLGTAGSKKEPNSLSFGSLFGSSKNFFLLQDTQNDYSDCVKKGSEIFFGSSPSLFGGLVGAFGAAVGVDTGEYRNVSQSPGYFNVLLRMLVKSTAETVGGAINSVVGLGAGILGETNPINAAAIGNGPMDIDRNIGLDNDPTSIFNALDSLRHSKILNFMDILAVIGDIAIITETTAKKTGFDSSIDAIDDTMDDTDIAEQRFPNPAALIKKDRLSSKTSARYASGMAWASNTIRSDYLSPITLNPTDPTGVVTRGLDGNPNFRVKANGGRISPQDVRAIEQELDACYMPFYFHDLRTNEIISFHAFIENVSDSFEADYTETEGYGRIGKVYTYKNTNRSIGCSFKVVSTNPEDFSEMWFKINKLVMLLYPQYTAGRSVSFTDASSGIQKKFIQPFSQLISNSPMIRLRLGDLFKTNYSELDMMRLFGFGGENFKITEKTAQAKESIATQEKWNSDTWALKERQKKYEFKVGDAFIFINDEAAGSRRAKSRILRPAKGKKKLPDIGSAPTVKITAVNKDAKEYTAQLASGEGDEFILNFAGAPVGKILPQTTLSVTPSGAGEEDQDANAEEFNKFFSPDGDHGNPIVKSFNSVAGQGLAGFIRRLSFDWSDARWETVGLNNRAPMWCKIDIDFTPVYDINPGLDSNGAIIGPPYNIGSLLGLMKNSRPAVEQAAVEAYNAKNKRAHVPVNSKTDKAEASEAAQEATKGLP